MWIYQIKKCEWSTSSAWQKVWYLPPSLVRSVLIKC